MRLIKKNRWATLLILSAGLLSVTTGFTLAGARPSPLISGMWVWAPQYVNDVAERDEMLRFCQRQGFNRLLIQVQWKRGTAQVVHPEPGQEAEVGMTANPQIGNPQQFASLIAAAAKKHIAVEALDGTPYMGDKIHWTETMATVNALLEFNNTLPIGARLAGIHWDIEPYVRTDWKTQATREPIETEYLQMLTDVHQRLHDSGSKMTLAVDIPMWYDMKVAPDDNCIVTFNGQTKNFHQHIQDITDYVGIMSYRQKALGPNSAFEQVANELAYAEKIGKYVCPAFETIELKDTPQITFFGKSTQQLQEQRQALENALRDRPGFGGMFLHCYPNIAKVLEQPAAETAAK